METKSYQYRIEEAAKEAKTRKELVEKVDAIVAEIVNEDPRLYGIGRKIAGYGTWHMTLWLNEYRFGEGLKGKLEQHYLVTNDEDKEFTLADFEEIINDTCQEYAYDQF